MGALLGSTLLELIPGALEIHSHNETADEEEDGHDVISCG